jgi:serine/threonine protein kinase
MEGSEFEISELDELERIVGDPTAKAKRLSLSLLRDITDDFSDECIVGRGGFGVVYKGLLPNGLVIAVRKMAYMPGLDGNEFENEVRTLMKVAHKNIVRFIGYCSHTIHEYVQHEGIYVLTESSQRLICMEYMVNGSLDKHIHADNFQGGLGWNLRFQILTGICHGLRHLHNEVDIIHGDIKPENILLDENFKPKITDFGLSRLLGGSSLIITNELMGTR